MDREEHLVSAVHWLDINLSFDPPRREPYEKSTEEEFARIDDPQFYTQLFLKRQDEIREAILLEDDGTNFKPF